MKTDNTIRVITNVIHGSPKLIFFIRLKSSD